MDAEFDTADGLWWITPDRPGSPSVEDFLMPPSLVGLATAVPTGAGLEYALVGLPGVPDPQQAPYAHAAFMGFSFRVVGEATPFLESEERPVEVPPDEEPPGGD